MTQADHVTPDANGWLAKLRSNVVSRLRDRIRDRPVALFDVPTHMNVGDSLIWEGERQHLRRVGAQIVLEADFDRWEPSTIRKLPADCVLLLHGGGNFGDLWPRFHEFRSRILESAPRHTIVQLPQSIRFSRPEASRRTRDILSRHPDYLLLVREQQSLAYALAEFPDVEVEFMDDMALGLVAPSGYDSSGRVVVLARGDQERAHDLSGIRLPREIDWRDWGDARSRKRSWRLSRIPRKIQRNLSSLAPSLGAPISPIVDLSYHRMRRMNITNGLSTLDGASLVITDRLHAHVLAGLMDIPCVVLDNNYGKVSGVYEASTYQFPSAHLAGSVEAAQEIANHILGTH